MKLAGSTCNQDGCEELGAFRYTWPGRDEAAVCLLHAFRLQEIASAMGLHVQLIPLFEPTEPAPTAETES